MSDQSLTFTMGWAESLPMLLAAADGDLANVRADARAQLERMAVIADKAAAALAKINAAPPARPATSRRDITAAERATLLAALTFYRRQGMGDDRRDALIDSIATSSGLFLALDNAGIEDLTAIIANATGLET